MFKKGQSGNPKGRTPGSTQRPLLLRDTIQKIMLEERKVEVMENGKKRMMNMTTVEALTRTTAAFAMKGDASARNFLADRWLGRAVQPLNFEGGVSGGIKIVFDGGIQLTGGNGDGNGHGTQDEIRLVDDNGGNGK